MLWVGAGIIGALAGQGIPASIEGLEFALVALFVVLAIDSFQNNKDYSLPLSACALGILPAPGRRAGAAKGRAMPAGVTLTPILAVLVPVGIVTVLLRWFPFAFVKALKGSQFISMLGFTMPVGVMTVLVVYTVFGQMRDTGNVLAPIAAAAVTAGLHLWRRNSGLSIFGGRLFYMALVNLVA